MDIQVLERKEIAESLALSPPCWVEDPAKLDDKACYHSFEVAASYAIYNAKLAYYVGLGSGALVALPECKGGQAPPCSVELVKLLSPAPVEEQNFLRSYYEGFGESLRRRSPQRVEIECSTTTCLLTYN